MRRILLSSLFFLAVLASLAQTSVINTRPPKHEVRAVWLTTIGGVDWPHSYAQSTRSAEKQQKELCDILDRLEETGINTVLIQTRIRGTMIYPSDYEPWDGCLSGFPGRSPGYDALKFAVDECHKRGMEVQAWVVTIPMGKWNALGCKSLRNRYPTLVKKIDADGYMNPEDSRTGDYLAAICKEITSKYDVDGIHLDYIRYPETWKLKVSRDQGRAYITRIVKKIHDAVKSTKPWVKLSCSPIGKFEDLDRYWSHGWNAYEKVCQDAQGWLRDGLMDELFPMMYFRNEQFFPFAIDWKERNYGKTVVPGLGIYFLDPKEGKWTIGDITREMYHLRNIGLGYAFFRNKFLLDNRQGILDFTKDKFNEYPALIPPMTWASSKLPRRPQNLKTGESDNCTVLTWKNPSVYEDGSTIQTPHIYNNVYASRKYPVDVTDARNLIKARTTDGKFTVKKESGDTPLYFAVTSMDGYGNESKATQNVVQSAESPTPNTFEGMAKLLENDGMTATLPNLPKNIKPKFYVVESDLGIEAIRIKAKSNTLDISTLPEGAYHIKVITKKGVTHTLGTIWKKKNKKS